MGVYRDIVRMIWHFWVGVWYGSFNIVVINWRKYIAVYVLFILLPTLSMVYNSTNKRQRAKRVQHVKCFKSGHLVVLGGNFLKQLLKRFEHGRLAGS